MITQQIHKQPMSRFSECDYRWAVILLNPVKDVLYLFLKS